MTTTDTTTPCVTYSNVYLHPLLDETTRSTGNRREQAMLQGQATKMCAECPLLAACLSDAVTKFDVSGFVAGTTRRQRQEIRKRLGITVADDDLDTWAGVNSSRSYDAEEILRLRQANPNEPLKFIAARMGCSISTVKRHLRRMSQEDTIPAVRQQRSMPSPDEILDMAAQVRGEGRRSTAA